MTQFEDWWGVYFLSHLGQFSEGSARRYLNEKIERFCEAEVEMS